MKKIFTFIFTIAIAFASMLNVNAIDGTATFTESKPLEQQYKFVNAGTTVKKAKLASGTAVWALCFNHAKEAPGVNSKLYLINNNNGKFVNSNVSTATVLTAGQINSLKNHLPAYVYILDNGIQMDGSYSWNNALFEDIAAKRGAFTLNEKYYATQLALWGVLYKDDTTNGVSIESLNQTQAGTSLNNSLLKVKEAAIRLRDKALKNSFVEPKIVVNNSKDMYPTSDRKYFRTDDYTVSGAGFNNYAVMLENAPAGAEIISNNSVIKSGTTLNAGQKFYVRVPYSNVKNGVSGTITLKAAGKKRHVSVYAPLDQTKQNIIVDYATAVPVVTKTTFKATQEKGDLLIEKVDNKGNYLAGATLVLSDTTGRVIDKWTTGNTKETNQRVFKNLNIGSKYVISEIVAPQGYRKIADRTITINTTKVQKVVLVDEDITSIKISKQDITTGKELPGATLVVTDASGKQIDKWVSTNEPHYIKKELTPGEYTLTEVIAPKGYILSTEKITFTVNKDGSVAGDIVMKNTPEKGVTISKQDATTDKELPGATLVLKDSKGNIVDTWVSTDKPHYISDLKDGKYYLSETIAPEGYDLSTTTVEFTIEHDGKVLEPVVMKNYPSKHGVYISKQDITTGKELPGATLVVKDSNGNVIDKWVSTYKPHFIANLKEGTYTLIETQSPKGYGLSEEVITFTIDKNGKNTKTVVMTNSPIPETSGINVTLFIIGLIASAGLMVFGFTKLNKQA